MVPAPAIDIRPAVAADAEQVAVIYAYHVLHGTASFDEVPPPASFWVEKIETICARRWPFLVAEQHGGVVGYCYATQFRDRPAYRETCESSVYVAHDRRGQGIGRALLSALIEAADAAGFRQMIAVVGGPEPASVALHAALGFVEAGRMREVGCKFGRRLDTLYMQRPVHRDAG